MWPERPPLTGTGRREAHIHIYLRGDLVQRLRLCSGLAIFLFAATHFLNHAVGLIGLEEMHLVQGWRLAITRSWPGTIVLAAALVTHMGLGLYRLAQRRTLQMPLWEAAQIVVALLIPFLLLPHIVNTRIASSVFGVQDSYIYELVRLWPDRGLIQMSLLVLVWVHGCIGLHYWLRLDVRYTTIAPWLIIAAVTIPVLAVAGFVVSGEKAGEVMRDPGALEALKQRSRWPNPVDAAVMARMRDNLQIGFGMVVAALALLLAWRHWFNKLETKTDANGREPSQPTVAYFDGPTCTFRPGATVLETSRDNRIAHAALCGGRARCGTCRVRIVSGHEGLPPPSRAEALVLAAIEAESDVRLACQLRPTSAVGVSVLVRPDEHAPIRVEFMEINETVAAHRLALIGERSDDGREAPAHDLRVVLKRGLDKGSPMGGMERPAANSSHPLRRIPNEVMFREMRKTYVRDISTDAFVYRWGSRDLTVFVLPSEGSDTIAVSGTKGDFSVIGWRDREAAMFAVTDVDLPTLEGLIGRATEAHAAPVVASEWLEDTAL